MKNLKIALLGALLLGSLAGSFSNSANAQGYYVVNPGLHRGWYRHHDFYRMYNNDFDRDDYWRWRRRHEAYNWRRFRSWY